MERARPDHDEETVILLCNDAGGFLATLNDGLFGMCWNGDLGCEKLGWDQRVVTKYYTVMLALALGSRGREYVPRTSSLGLVESLKEDMSGVTVVAGAMVKVIYLYID